MRYIPAIALIVAVFVPGMIITAAQNQPLRFEVASVKPNLSGDNRAAIMGRPGGRYVPTISPSSAFKDNWQAPNRFLNLCRILGPETTDARRASSKVWYGC